jgi:hypothetical protein
LEVDIPPFQSKEFAHPQARASVQQDKSSLAQPETSNQLLKLAGTQHGWELLPFREGAEIEKGTYCKAQSKLRES